MWKISPGKQDQIRFKRLRVLLDDLHSTVRGWRFRFASREKTALHEAARHCLSDVSTVIRFREGLQEINRNRIDNMRRAAALVDGVRLQPGEIFSLRHMVGDPTEQRGFKKGPIIIRGRLGFTSGGGLCQVSTTLFNAALAAGMRILQKHNHSMDIWGDERFVDLGMDATYVFGRKDLKFENTHPAAVVLRVSVLERERVFNCRILSTAPLAGPVRVERTIIEEITPSVPDPAGCYTVVKGWTVLTTRYAGEGPSRIVTYRKLEKYKPSVIRKEASDAKAGQNDRPCA